MARHLPTCAGLIVAIVLLASGRTANAAPGSDPVSPALPPASAPASSPASPPAQALELTLVLELGVLSPEVGERLGVAIDEQFRRAFADAGFVLTSTPTRAGASVELRFLAFDADRSDYEVQLTVDSGGTSTELERLRCYACSEARLLEEIEEQLPAVFDQLDALRPAPAPAQLAAAPPPVLDEHDEPARPAIGGLGIGGALLLAGGAVVIGFGAQRLALGYVEEQNPSKRRIEFSDFRPAGGALLGAGLAALIAGGTLLIVDLKNRRPRGRNVSSLQYSLQLERNYAGLGLLRRF